MSSTMNFLDWHMTCNEIENKIEVLLKKNLIYTKAGFNFADVKCGPKIISTG